jgi:hypothetical protein
LKIRVFATVLEAEIEIEPVAQLAEIEMAWTRAIIAEGPPGG